MRFLYCIVLAMACFSQAARSADHERDFGSLSPLEVYKIIKTARRDAQTRADVYKRTADAPIPADYDLIDCNFDFGREEVHGGGPESAAILAATLAVRYERDLARFGVPSAVWQKHLAGFDRVGVATIAATNEWNQTENAISSFDAARDRIDGVRSSLHNSLAKYRTKHQGRPRFVLEGGCGAGEEKIELAGNAAMVTFRFIPYYNYRVCQLLGVDPEDAAVCVGWSTRRAAGRVVQLDSDSGYLQDVYRYVAKLPGGAVKRGEFFAALPQGDDQQVIRVDLN